MTHKGLLNNTTLRKWSASLLLWLVALTAAAQGETTIMIDVQPVQDILPPQVGDYKANPGKYFTVSLINNTGEVQNVYLTLQIMQTLEKDGSTPGALSVSSPPTRMPKSPIEVPANGSVTLSMEQMRRICDHISVSEMQFSADLFSTFGSADYGLLPEGYYKILLSAYKWDPTLLDASNLVVSPVALSNPSITGSALFQVCYRAQAPQFTDPTAALGTAELYDLQAVKLPLMAPEFAWTEPVINCWRDDAPTYQYTLTVKEVMRVGQIQQTVDDVLQDPGYVFRITGIGQPFVTLTSTNIKKLLDGHLYLAQVEARPTGITDMTFSMVENDGKSMPLLFTPDMGNDNDDLATPEEEEEEEEDEIEMLGINTEYGGNEPYVFRNPQLVKPDFDGNTNNALFAGNTLIAEWKRPLHAGGEGEKPDTVQFRYKTQIYNLSGYATKDIALEQEPIYEGWAKGEFDAESLMPSGKGLDNVSIKSSTTSTLENKLSGRATTDDPETLLGLLQEYVTLMSKQQGTSSTGSTTASKPGKTAAVTETYFAGKIIEGATQAEELTAVEKARLKKLEDVLSTLGITSVTQAEAKIKELQEQISKTTAAASGESAEDVEGLETLSDYVKWSDISDKVSVGQLLLLRIVPEAAGQDTVRFYGDVNELVFQYTDKLSEAFGDACAGGMIEENRMPGQFTQDEMKGQEIFVGEYVMTMGDDVKQDSKTRGWSGTGWMLWQPFGQQVKVGVKFENIFINSDRIMYDGTVKTETKSNWQHIKERAQAYGESYTAPDGENGAYVADQWIPEDIFTEWGLDNIVGYALPAEETPLLNAVGTVMARQEANSLAQKIKASKYYDYVRKGYAVYENFQKKGVGGFPDIEVFLPLQVSDINIKKNPVDIQIVSMEFHPTFAWMNLMGMYSLPGNIGDDQILIFGAPRTCMDPDRVLPGSGVIMLMSEVTLKDPDSDFDFTFRVPNDFQNPSDGCYIKWDNDTLSALSLHADMTMPGLIKCDANGNVLTGQHPKTTVHTWIQSWENWHASVTIDPFTHEDVKGWVFTAQDVTYDHSSTWNPSNIVFPDLSDGYILADAGITGADYKTWQGLFIKKLEVRMPKGLISDSRITLTADNMLLDPSGVSLAFNANKVIKASYGGWEMNLDHIFMNIVQNQFKDCGFSGSMAVPLMNRALNFRCNFYPLEREDGSTDFDCILKCVNDEQLDNLSFDFFLATLDLDKEQTYFLLESKADRASSEGERQTRIELCLGGEINIGGADNINANLAALTADLPMKLRIPGIHFTQMRIANCERWIADEDTEWGKEIAKMQNTAINKSIEYRTNNAYKELCEQNTYVFGDDFYFERGWWSVASPEKTIGPFKFGITKYNIVPDIGANTIGLSITGRMALMDKGTSYDNNKIDENSLISTSVTLRIDCNVDVQKKKLTYKGTNLEEIELDVNADFCCVAIQGKLTLGSRASTDGTSKGFSGELTVTLPGDLLHFTADGGFYEHSAGYKWGYVYLGMGGKMGVEITPLKVTNVGAGIYFNCYPNAKNKSNVTPKNGLIGVMADLGLSSSDGELVSGDFHLSVLYDKSANNGKGRLTTFLFTGDCKAVAGIIDTKVTIHWQDDDTDKYFQLTATVDATASGSKIVDAMGNAVGASEIASQMKLLNDKWESAKGAVTGTLENAMGDDSTEKAHATKANTKDVEAEKKDKPTMGAQASLDFKLTFRENGKNLSKCKWHVYLGEPEEKKRCAFTLINLHTAIVDVNIGANFYFCVGNELPNNGELPPIPDKIQKFLNGGSVGGMQGTDISKANKAREKAKKMFSADSEIEGGVMLGAAWYGSVDVRLGLFYGDMGVIAGIDAALAKLKVAECPGYGKMGYKGWYAEGQIYAYLYAKFGIHVNLGFWDKKFDIIDAGIGGVLKAGLPHPTYFVGDARIKLKLMGGLVNINRRFQFECGHVCDAWYGNPLDNFELFGDCTIGSANVKEGWAENADLVSPATIQKPYYYTQAPIDENFRVLDENTLHDLEEKYEGDREELEMQSKRTFIFRHTNMVYANQKPMLLEWSYMPDTIGIQMDSRADRAKTLGRFMNSAYNKPTVYNLTQKALGQTRFTLEDLNSKLHANRYYALVVMGTAKEIIKGKEELPREYDSDKGEFVNREWNQAQFYFFRTGTETPNTDDAADLEPYVAMAFPSERGQIRSLSGEDTDEIKKNDRGWELIYDQVSAVTVNASGDSGGNAQPTLTYLEDANNPNIALTQQLFFTDGNGKRIATEGYPYSQVYNAISRQRDSNIQWIVSAKHKDGTKFTAAKGANIVTKSGCQNITGSNLGWQAGDEGTLALVYRYYEYREREESTLVGYETVEEIGGDDSDNGSAVTRPSGSSSTNTRQTTSSGRSSTSTSRTRTSTATTTTSTTTTATTTATVSSRATETLASATGTTLLTSLSSLNRVTQSGEQIAYKTYTTATSSSSSNMYEIEMTVSKDNSIKTGLINPNQLDNNYSPEAQTHSSNYYTFTQEKYGTKTVVDTIEHYKILYALNIKVVEGDWLTGYNDGKQRVQLNYSKPYVGMSLSEVQTDYTINDQNDEQWAKDTDKRLYDPYLYLSYMANYLFIGGHPIKDYSFTDMADRNDNYVPTSESLIYMTKIGETSGNYDLGISNNIYAGRDKIRKMSLFEYSRNSAYGSYPLPAVEDCGWATLVTTSQQTPLFIPGDDAFTQTRNYLGDIAAPYYLAEAASEMLSKIPANYGNGMQLCFYAYTPAAWEHIYSLTSASNFKNNWMVPYSNTFTGLYKTVSYIRPNGQYRNVAGKVTSEALADTFLIKVPYYQLPLIFGGTFNHGGSTKYFTLHESMPSIKNSSRAVQEMASLLFYRATGGIYWTAHWTANKYYLYQASAKNQATGVNKKTYTKENFDADTGLKHVKNVSINCYRVNAYDYNAGLFVAETGINAVTHNKLCKIDYPFKNKNWKQDGKKWVSANVYE